MNTEQSYKGYTITFEPNYGDGSFTRPYIIRSFDGRRPAFPIQVSSVELAQRLIDAEVKRVEEIGKKYQYE